MPLHKIPPFSPRAQWLPVPMLVQVLLWTIVPGLVAFHAWRTLEMRDEQRDLLLRDTVGRIAARLETLPGTATGTATDALFAEEPSLISLRVADRTSADPVAHRILGGEQLFQVEDRGAEAWAWVPFHREGELSVARLQISTEATALYNRFAQQSIALVSGIAALLLLLAWVATKSAAERAAMEERQAATAHLTRMGEMAAVLAHEIRNPLASIKGFAQLLEEQQNESTRGFASEIVGQSIRLERLVSDLLQYGRIPQPQFTQTPWSAVREALQREDPTFETDERAQVEVSAAELMLKTDATLLEMALRNLVRNAREAVADRPDGAVRVTVKQVAQQAAICVEDNGPGLSESARAHLFQPFFTTKAFGTGLGLATSQKLARALGGSLDVDNGEGGGLCVTLRLPLAPEGSV